MTTKQAKFIETVSVITYQKREKPRKHYVFQIQVSWTDGTEFYIFRSYNRFYSFHATLVKLFPNEAKKSNNGESLPSLPNRIFFGRSHLAKVAEARLDAINKYCQALTRLPKHISDSRHVTAFFTALPGDIMIPVRDVNTPPSLHPLMWPTGNVWENYVVTKDFQAEKDSNQLSLKKGETIQIIHKDDSGWWMAADGDLTGWVPPSFIRPESTLTDSPDEEDDDIIGLNIPGGKVIDTEEYRAIDDYQGTEDSQVSFREGDIVTVVDKEDDGWWFVYVHGREGWAPFSYLEPVHPDSGKGETNSEGSEEEDTLQVNYSHISKYGKLPEATVTKEYTAIKSDELSVPINSNVQVMKRSITGWWTIKYNGRAGFFPAVYLQEKSRDKRVSLQPQQRALVPKRKPIISLQIVVIKVSKSVRGTGVTPLSSDDEEDNLYKDHSSYARCKSPPRPPRPPQTLIEHVLTPNLTPSISPSPYSQGKNVFDMDRNSPIGNRSISPIIQQQKSSTDDAALVSALLKVILKSGSIEMKAHLMDIMIDNPILAERLKEAKEQWKTNEFPQ